MTLYLKTSTNHKFAKKISQSEDRMILLWSVDFLHKKFFLFCTVLQTITPQSFIFPRFFLLAGAAGYQPKSEHAGVRSMNWTLRKREGECLDPNMSAIS